MSMAGYTKLFNSILASTIWEADMPTRIVWITMLAMADKHGVVEGSVPGLATFARVSISQCRLALEALMAPDPDSRSKEQDGRRIEPIAGGWRLVNHAKYRAKLNDDERREYLRIKQREYRRKHVSTNVNDVSNKSTVLTQAEAEAEAEAKKIKNVSDAPKGLSPPRLIFPIKGGGHWRLRAVSLDFWVQSYPALDVVAELTKAQAWCEANPSKRKTVKGMPRFCVNWLNTATHGIGEDRHSPRRPQQISQHVKWIADCQARHNGTCESSAAHWRKKNSL